MSYTEEIKLQRVRTLATDDDIGRNIAHQQELFISNLKNQAKIIFESKIKERNGRSEDLKNDNSAAQNLIDSKVSEFQSAHHKFIQAAGNLNASLADDLKNLNERLVTFATIQSNLAILPWSYNLIFAAEIQKCERRRSRAPIKIYLVAIKKSKVVNKVRFG
jgi:hypothetical protein